MTVAPKLETPDHTTTPRSRKATPWLVRGSVVIFVAAVGVALWFIRREAKNQLSELSWDLALEGESTSRPGVSADVGPIQFLKDHPGFSISFEQVSYVADGLHLQGRIGNASLLYVSTLTLEFAVTKQLWQYKDDFMTGHGSYFFLFLEPVGKAQSKPIETLNPGTTQGFEVTVPNIRQTKDGVRLLVSFSGERYSVGR